MYYTSEWLQKVNERDRGNFMPLFIQFDAYDRRPDEITRRYRRLQNQPGSAIVDHVIGNLRPGDNADFQDKQAGGLLFMKLDMGEILMQRH